MNSVPIGQLINLDDNTPDPLAVTTSICPNCFMVLPVSGDCECH